MSHQRVSRLPDTGVNRGLVGACLATGDRIFVAGSDRVSKLFCDPVAVVA